MLRKYSAVLALAALSASALVAEQKVPKGAAARDTISSQQAEAILGELREIRLLLEKNGRALVAPAPSAPAAPAPAAVVSLNTSGQWQMLGDKNAPLTMVEYFDFQCSFCQRFETGTFAEIKKNLIDTGKLRYFSRNFPLDMHPFAAKAAQAGQCAAEQNKFWVMRDAMVMAGNNLGADNLQVIAKTVGLDPVPFKQCLDSGKYQQSVQDSIKEGASVGVQGTPSFVVGKTTAQGVTGSLIVGDLPFAVFEAEMKKQQGK